VTSAVSSRQGAATASWRRGTALLSSSQQLSGRGRTDTETGLTSLLRDVNLFSSLSGVAARLSLSIQ
jgi:hypothetical protein